MPIIRGRHHFDGHFTQVPNAWIRDTRLSLKARGLLTLLMSHEPGFEVSRERLARSGQDGDGAIRSAIAELEAAGYLKRSQIRSSGQRFGAAVWITQDPPSPSVSFSPAENPHAENLGAKNTNKKNTKEEKDLAQQVERDFEAFWANYPRRVGKRHARKVFERVWTPELDLVEAAKRLATDPNLPPLQYVPHAATWLNREGWLDEPYPARALTAEEKAAKDAAEREARIERDRIRRQKEAEEAELERIRGEQARASVRRCEHDRVFVMCSVCNRTQKDSPQ